MKKEELENLKRLLESADLSQLKPLQVEPNMINLEGQDLSQLHFPFTGKEELENLKKLLESADFSQLHFPKINPTHDMINLEGQDLSQIVLPSTEDRKMHIDSYTNTTKAGISRNRADLYSSKQVLSTDEERKEDGASRLKR